MNVFEDLVEELKEENLLEETVIDLKRAAAAPGGVDQNDAGLIGIGVPTGEGGSNGIHDTDIPQIEKPSSEREFFRKRAIDEVSSLQMVEHVLSAVEREHVKITPVSFDDLEAKKALHRFLQVAGDPRSVEHAETEFALRQETESWSFALFERDQNISVGNIRRFCEESRPLLSSQALISLARFYRNAPFSEQVRGKFDFVVTRLFSRDGTDETRRLLFPKHEMVGHISTLYANWSSIAMYSQAGDQIDVSTAVTRFNEFGVEIESAETFDELLETDFFSRVRLYKEELGEMFYVPEVMAAAVGCNLKIGNKYVRLINLEKSVSDAETVEQKYGYNYDQLVSNAAGKTLLLADLLQLTDQDQRKDFDAVDVSDYGKKGESYLPVPGARSGSRFELFGVNRWVMILAFAAIFAGGGIYVWVDKFVADDTSTAVAKPLEIGDADVEKHLRSFRSTNETLYAMTQPTFEVLTEPERKVLLQKVLKLANDRKLEKVNLLNDKGRTIAFASKERVELVAQ